MSNLASTLYAAHRAALSDPTSVPAWGNADAETRGVWERVAEVARQEVNAESLRNQTNAESLRNQTNDRDAHLAELTRLSEDVGGYDTRMGAYARVARVLNDRSGFHVDGLDKETRVDLLDAIVKAVLG